MTTKIRYLLLDGRKTKGEVLCERCWHDLAFDANPPRHEVQHVAPCEETWKPCYVCKNGKGGPK